MRLAATRSSISAGSAGVVARGFAPRGRTCDRGEGGRQESAAARTREATAWAAWHGRRCLPLCSAYLVGTSRQDATPSDPSPGEVRRISGKIGSQPMDALDLLLTRESALKLDAPAPSEADLDKMFQSAVRAPDHGRLRPWRFVVIEADKRARFGDLMAESDAQRATPTASAEMLRSGTGQADARADDRGRRRPGAQGSPHSRMRANRRLPRPPRKTSCSRRMLWGMGRCGRPGTRLTIPA